LGNICRSPFAEHLAKKILDNKSRLDIFVSSAGLKVKGPSPSPEEAILAAERFGVQLDKHRSKLMDYKLIQSVDMVIAMEMRQITELKRTYPMLKEKFFLLPLLDPLKGNQNRGYHRYNIVDPYGKRPEDFFQCYKRIERCILNLLNTL
jgi:protein-tyrosine phosphatase